jgi:hypothetical protein
MSVKEALSGHDRLSKIYSDVRCVHIAICHWDWLIVAAGFDEVRGSIANGKG